VESPKAGPVVLSMLMFMQLGALHTMVLERHPVADMRAQTCQMSLMEVRVGYVQGRVLSLATVGLVGQGAKVPAATYPLLDEAQLLKEARPLLQKARRTSRTPRCQVGGNLSAGNRILVTQELQVQATAWEESSSMPNDRRVQNG
jgi:hypothetical protein